MSHVSQLSHVSHMTDPWDMLNNFCFHVLAQTWLFVMLIHVIHVINMSHVNHVSHVSDPWDMLNNFCFYV